MASKTKKYISTYQDDHLSIECLYDPERDSTCLSTFNGTELQVVSSFTQKKQVLCPEKLLLQLVQSGTLRLPTAAAKYSSEAALLEQVRSFIRRYVDLPESFETICVYYVLMSWIYDRFNELPYLRVRGNYGSGKTRFLQVVGSLCYLPLFASGASTTAPIFHLLDRTRGTLILDESDFRYSDATADIAKILNNGNAKGFTVLRCEQVHKGGFTVRSYNIFGPKVVAARESFSDVALESRFVTCDLHNRPIRADIPITLPASFADEAQAIRNQLLYFRQTTILGTGIKTVAAQSSESYRSAQIFHPLLSLARSPEEREAMLAFISEQEAQLRSDRGLQTEAEVLQIVADLLKRKEPLSISQICRSFMLRYGQRYSRKISPRWIGFILRSKLHLATRKSNGVYIISEGQTDRLNLLFRTYDVESDEGAIQSP